VEDIKKPLAMSKKSLVVNFFGGPGTGKSTVMAHCFAELKWKNIDCEMCLEYAKDKIWEGSEHVLDNQFYVSGKQYQRLKRLEGKVDIILTDSPILLGIIYGQKEPVIFKDLMIEYHNTFNNLNIFLKRSKPFHQNGRIQNEEESKIIDSDLYNFVGSQRGDFLEAPASRERIDSIVSTIEMSFLELKSFDN
jgi:hypothetical protein